MADQPDRCNAPHNQSKREYYQRQRRELGWRPAHQVQGPGGGAPPMSQEGEMMVQPSKWSGKAPPARQRGGMEQTSARHRPPMIGAAQKGEGPSLKTPHGGKGDQTLGVGGRGAKMHTAVKEVPRAPPSEDEDGVSRRLRPAVRMWSGS